MSSQKGNVARQRPQKYQNRSVFKNNLHDTSHRTKTINNTKIENVCMHCKEVIQWKIKYKKYKPLSQPKTCVRCNERCVCRAYHVMCSDCARLTNACPKCCKTAVEIVPETESDDNKLRGELDSLLKSLPERKRRTFLRYMSKKNEANDDQEVVQKDLMDKIKKLAVDEDDDFDLGDSEDDPDEDDTDEDS